MSVFCIHGIPGGGKSYVTLRDFILEELLHGQRFLAVAFPLNLGELNAYIQKKYPKYDVDVLGRVRILDRLEAKRFWLYGPGNYQLEDVTPEQEKADVFPDFEALHKKFPQGIMYVIDEAHLYFDARAWSKVGLSLSTWSSQHRKMNHQAVFVTQHIDKLEKRLRLDAEQFIQCLNYGQRHIWTFFRLPQKFRTLTRYTYPGPVDRNSLASMDFELAACYDTSAGVGLLGHSKPETKRTTGISVYWIFPVLAIAVWIISEIPGWLAKGAISSLPGGKKVSADTPAQVSQAEVAIAKPDAPKTPIGETAEGIWITGYATDGQRLRVTLSNGTVLAEDDPELRNVTVRRNSMTLADGRTYRMRLNSPAGVSAGSGVRVTPVSVDGVPPHVASLPSANSTRERNDRGSEAVASQQHGSWVTGSDGVSRLRESPSFSEAAKR